MSRTSKLEGGNETIVKKEHSATTLTCVLFSIFVWAAAAGNGTCVRGVDRLEFRGDTRSQRFAEYLFE